MTDTQQTDSLAYHLDCADIEWRDNDVPCAKHYKDIYYSATDGLEESRYVFLKHNRLHQRWQTLALDTAGIFSIAEIGFGTGLNFLACWQLWQQLAPVSWQLHVVSVEKHPLRPEDLQRSLKRWPELAAHAEQLINAYPVMLPGHHLIKFDHGRVNLHLLLGDADDCFEQMKSTSSALATVTGHKFDAWFLDGFAPSKNPQLWQAPLLEHVARLSKLGTTLATFTVAGHVRRTLTTYGFTVKKVPGFGQKREMLQGTFTRFPDDAHSHSPTQKRRGQTTTPWYVLPQSHYSDRHAVVIGAGLAGTNSAYALASRGWQVTLIERDKQVAAGASGNSQGMLYTRLSPRPGTLNTFALSSYLYALRFYQQLANSKQLLDHHYSFCGMLQLVNNGKERRHFNALQQQLAGQSQWVQFIDADAASQISGVSIDCSAYYFPGSGWCSPSALCRQLAAHPRIELMLDTQAISLQQQSTLTGKQWHIYGKNKRLLSQTDVVIIANNIDANTLTQCHYLPLKPIRGQVSTIKSEGELSKLRCVVCHDGYITPAIDGKNTLGATFDIGDRNTEIRPDDHRHNLQALQQALPSMLPKASEVTAEALGGRAGIRCATPDYLPVVGQLPDHSAFLHDYARLRKDASWPLDNPGRYFAGLYINVGHGSKGLTSIPLCSELLAAQINNEPLPLPRQLIKALNPARFIIRDLIRNKC